MKSYLTSFVLAAVCASNALADSYRQSIGVGALEIVNVKISGGVDAAGSEPSLAPRTNREYLDGFNRVDSSGNLGEGAPGLASRTGNFGFVSDSQVDLQRGTLSLHTVSPGDTRYVRSSSRQGDVAPELYYRILRERGGRSGWGVEGRVGRIDVDYSSTATLSSSVRLLTDAYPLGGVVPQPAPYTGSFQVQPGTQRIGDIPTRTITNATATVQGRREFSAEGWLVRLGVVWQPIETARADVQVHAGPAALNVKGAFKINDRWLSGSLTPLATTAEGSRRAWIGGGYAGATANVHLGSRWDVFGGADFLFADKFKVTRGGGTAKFDFSQSVLLSLGAAWRF